MSGTAAGRRPYLLYRPLTIEERVTGLAVEFATTAEHHDRTAAFPFANFDRLAEADLLALTVPRRLGGRGAGLAEAAMVVGGVAQGEPSTALVLAMQYAMHATIAGRGWPEVLADRLGREAASGVSLTNALRV